jgi:hypothetical protein
MGQGDVPGCVLGGAILAVTRREGQDGRVSPKQVEETEWRGVALSVRADGSHKRNRSGVTKLAKIGYARSANSPSKSSSMKGRMPLPWPVSQRVRVGSAKGCEAYCDFGQKAKQSQPEPQNPA